MKGPLEYVGQYRWFNPSFYPSLCPYIHGEKTPPALLACLSCPLITPSTGEAEPRGSSCVLYDTYNTFCTIHNRNVLNATNEWALAPAQVFVSARKVELFEDPTSIRTRLITWTVPVITFSYTRLLTVSRRVRAKRSREGVPAFCTIPIILKP